MYLNFSKWEILTINTFETPYTSIFKKNTDYLACVGVIKFLHKLEIILV